MRIMWYSISRPRDFPVNNRIIEIGAVKVSGGEIVDRFSTFVNSGGADSLRNQKLTSHPMAMDAVPPDGAAAVSAGFVVKKFMVAFIMPALI